MKLSSSLRLYKMQKIIFIQYADWILDSLDQEKNLISYRLYRQHASINKNTYVKDISNRIQKKAFLKNKINNYFVPKIGFSDDDLKNVEVVKKHFEQDPENIIKTYSTAGGIKKEY